MTNTKEKNLNKWKYLRTQKDRKNNEQTNTTNRDKKKMTKITETRWKHQNIIGL